MLVLPYDWNIQYQKKKFISNVALTEQNVKRYLPTAIYFHFIRHIKLWNSLSALFNLLLEPWESAMTVTQLCAFFKHPSLCFSGKIPLFVFRVNLVLWNVSKPELCELGRCQKFHKSYHRFLYWTSWAMKNIYSRNCFIISHKNTTKNNGLFMA